jgi:hypothetical protein
MKRIAWGNLVLSRRQFTEKTSFDRKRKRLSKFRHLYLVLTTLGICMPIPVFAQTRSDESDSKASVVRVPFVGCPSDGQVGPKPAPKAASMVVRLKSLEAKMLAYYEAEVAGGVLAPRGWHGFGSYGTSGSSLTVTPHALKTLADVFAGEKGPAIAVHDISGEMSGRFAVAQVLARIFPTQIKLAESVIKEGTRPESDFPSGPYPKDKLTYRSDRVVEFRTPPHSEGLGTQFGFTPNDEPVNGVAIILLGESPDDTPSLELLLVRLKQENELLASVIIQQFERNGVAPEKD